MNDLATEWIEKEEARDAVRAMRLVRYQVRQKLGLVDM